MHLCSFYSLAISYRLQWERGTNSNRASIRKGTRCNHHHSIVESRTDPKLFARPMMLGIRPF